MIVGLYRVGIVVVVRVGARGDRQHYQSRGIEEYKHTTLSLILIIHLDLPTIISTFHLCLSLTLSLSVSLY